jgi:hypothetical protein
VSSNVSITHRMDGNNEGIKADGIKNFVKRHEKHALSGDRTNPFNLMKATMPRW